MRCLPTASPPHDLDCLATWGTPPAGFERSDSRPTSVVRKQQHVRLDGAQ
jgi:hypothetical protein